MNTKTIISEADNVAFIHLANGTVFVLRSTEGISIKRFYEWYISDTYYPLLTDEQWESTQETTQDIKIEVA